MLRTSANLPSKYARIKDSAGTGTEYPPRDVLCCCPEVPPRRLSRSMKKNEVEPMLPLPPTSVAALAVVAPFSQIPEGGVLWSDFAALYGNVGFTDQYYLKVHQRKHTGEKPLECSICEKRFYDPRSLKTHLTAHKGIKMYLCSYCGKSFLQNSHLTQHITVHDQNKPYVCTMCQKRFTQSASLRRHQKGQINE
ncbi:hypothetical protein HUJ05_005020 [Dendroctonus ponderosae]|nr:hypothetical protein HUJ05_005020 [Dendroctonus ponderosae]